MNDGTEILYYIRRPVAIKNMHGKPDANFRTANPLTLSLQTVIENWLDGADAEMVDQEDLEKQEDKL